MPYILKVEGTPGLEYGQEDDYDYGAPDCIKIWRNYVIAITNEPFMHSAAIDKLHEYNATDIADEPFVEFLTEEDAIAFKLKFG